MEISTDNRDEDDSIIKSPIKQETANLLIQLQSGPPQLKPESVPGPAAVAVSSVGLDSASPTVVVVGAGTGTGAGGGSGSSGSGGGEVTKKSPVRKLPSGGSPSAGPEAKKQKQQLAVAVSSSSSGSSPSKGVVTTGATENGIESGSSTVNNNLEQESKAKVKSPERKKDVETSSASSPQKGDIADAESVIDEPELIELDDGDVKLGRSDDAVDVSMEEESKDDKSVEDEDQEQEEAAEEQVYCLACGQNLTEEDVDGEIAQFDAGKYEQFLSESLHIDLLSMREEEKLRKEGSWTTEAQNSNFCGRCQEQIIRLYDLHESMSKAVALYEEERDKVALNIVSTFLVHSKPFDEFPLEVHKESVTTRWKKIYTGEASKEKEIYKIVKDRENKVASRVKRFQKLKGSFRSRHANSLLDKKRRIQQKMTSIYFTPKPQVVRKRKQVFLRVAVPESSGESTLACPICDKFFKQEYSLTIHLRSHAAENGKLYKCSICDKVCSSRQQLMQHRKDDHSDGEKIIKCDSCEETFVSRAAFKTHVKTHIEIKSFACEICAKDFPSSYYLKKHMVSHENVDFSVTDLFSCKTCSKTFLRSQDLNDHLKIHDNSKLFGCDFCGKGFAEEDIYKQHMLVHTGGNPYICDECGLRFSSEALLVSHLKVHRPKGHVCQECGKACRSRDGLRKHQLIHTGKKPFSCHICNIGFIERKSFDAHMVKHTGKLPYKCNYCNTDEGFKDAKDLRRHKVLKHPEFVPTDRKYSCDFCWNGFSTLEIMQEHKRKIHERYKCQHCNRVFKLGDHLRRHMYIHTGEKPYKCALCDKSFNQESNLKEHMYRHTGIRPHRCPHCPGVGYLRRMHLKEHMVKEHGTDIVPSLPMGRAAQNARRTGRHPVPTPVISGVKTEPMNMDGYEQPEILVSSSNPQNCIILLQSKGSY